MWRKRQTDSKTNVNILEITYPPFQSSFFLLFVNPVSKEQKFSPVPSFPLSSTPMEPPFGPSISTHHVSSILSWLRFIALTVMIASNVAP